MSQSISLVELQKRLQNIPPSELSSPREIKSAIKKIAKEMDTSIKDVEVKVRCKTSGGNLECATEVEIEF
jgi:hypothetical protein